MEDFANRLAFLIDEEATSLARDQVATALGGARPQARGAASGSLKRRRPKQFCPVPYCRNVAAPIFGMVCAKHKDVPKSKVKKYRAALREKSKRAA